MTPPVVPMSEEVARANVDAWVARFAAMIDADLAAIWTRPFPKVCARIELEARLPFADRIIEIMAQRSGVSR